VEIFVITDDRTGEVSDLQEQFPTVSFLHLEGHRTYAELRAHGVKKSHGQIVALTEDHCIPEPDWCARILDAHLDSHSVVGGAVEKGVPDTTINWAIYFLDYLRYMNPLTEGESNCLTDCNVSYKRAALDEIADVWSHEFHEPDVHWALMARGESLWLSPKITVRQQRSFSLNAAIWDRFSFGRLFAVLRLKAISPISRMFYAGGSFILPFLLVGRIAAQVVRKRRALTAYIRALPALTLLATVWAGGELAGYLTGRPGTYLMPASGQPGLNTRGSQEASQ